MGSFRSRVRQFPSDPVVGGGGSGYAFTSYGGGDSGGVRILFAPGLTYPTTGDR